MNSQPVSQTNQRHSDEDKERELIVQLHHWGIHYLTIGEIPPLSASILTTDQAAVATFLQAVATCQNVRVRDALISLLLLHPELSASLLTALQESPVENTLSSLTLATLYLQQLWRYRLALAFGHFSTFPEAPFASLWQSRVLPPPSAYQGRWGLAALERQEQMRLGLPLTFQGDWQNQVAHLLLQEEARQHSSSTLSLFEKTSNEDAPLSLPVPINHEQEYRATMSMRPNVDRPRIEHFLSELGRYFRQPGRLYLVGGAALVHAGIRPGSSATTQDIDVEVAAGDMYQTIGQLKQQLNINIEFASPGDFIPLPHNWQQVSRYVGRYGKVDVFYFDFYSIALSKIERGNARDLQDVTLLLAQKVITLPELDRLAQEIAVQMGKGAYKRLDPHAFLTRYQAIRSHL